MEAIDELEREAREELIEEKKIEVKAFLKKTLLRIEVKEKELARIKEQYRKQLNMEIDELYFQIMHLDGF
jgi:hypothetical protein